MDRCFRGATVTFEIQRDGDGDGLADTAIYIPAGVTEFADSMLADSVTYSYKLQARNGYFSSEFTETKEAMTYPQGDVPDYEEYNALQALYDSLGKLIGLTIQIGAIRTHHFPSGMV